MAKFEGVVPAATLQANMAIASLDNIGFDVFQLADMEILDADLSAIPRGNPNTDFTPNARDRTRHLPSLFTVSPWLIQSGGMDFHPSNLSKSNLHNSACERAESKWWLGLRSIQVFAGQHTKTSTVFPSTGKHQIRHFHQVSMQRRPMWNGSGKSNPRPHSLQASTTSSSHGTADWKVLKPCRNDRQVFDNKPLTPRHREQNVFQSKNCASGTSSC
jgi:hypothetical protein